MSRDFWVQGREGRRGGGGAKHAARRRRLIEAATSKVNFSPNWNLKRGENRGGLKRDVRTMATTN